MLKALCSVLGDTGSGLTGSEIGTLLRHVASTLSRRAWRSHRLYESLAACQDRDGVSNNVFAFVQAALHLARYVGKSQLFEERQASLDGVLALAGLRVDDEGRVATVQRALTASEAEQRASRLRAELVRRAGARRCAQGMQGGAP
jgi:hypothetical protein